MADTPVDPIAPSDLAAAEAAARGVPVETITAAKIRLPKRVGVAGQTSDGGPYDVFIATETADLASYRTKGGTVAAATLGDYYTSQGAILVDAFLAGNLAGGTPSARPEDLEASPHNRREVFIAYTDGAPGGDGYPDSRVFVVGKYTPEVDDTQQFGGLYKIREDSHDSTGTTFRWERFQQSGESGAEDGDGFANLDNLAFDEDGNVWGVTDMSTAAAQRLHDRLQRPDAPARHDRHRPHRDRLGGRQPGRHLRHQLDLLPAGAGTRRRRDPPVRLRSAALRDDRAHLRRRHAAAVGAAPQRGLADQRRPERRRGSARRS